MKTLPGLRLVAKLPEGAKITGILAHEGEVFITAESGELWKLKKGKLKRKKGKLKRMEAK